jgi:uncharacterized membrane protein
MPRYFSVRPALTFRGRKFKGVRGFAGKPFHPPLTDLPVACYVIVAAFDLISYFAGDDGTIGRDFFISGTHVIVVGAITSLAAAVTGFWDWWKGMEREPGGLFGLIGRAKRTQAWRTANTHMTIMLTVTALVIIDIIVRIVQWDDGVASLVVLILSLVIGGLVTVGATYGGSLVYDYEFNVEQSYGAVWEEREDDIYPGQTLP